MLSRPRLRKRKRKKNSLFHITVPNGIRKSSPIVLFDQLVKPYPPPAFFFSALYDDACLFVVPNSHRRVRTSTERDITINDPLSHKMPEQLKVDLKAGQTVFYDNNILHRASYDCTQKRSTLHASMGTIEGGHHRAAVILQHGLDWMNTEEFKNTLPQSLIKPHTNVIEMANKAGISNMSAKPIH